MGRVKSGISRRKLCPLYKIAQTLGISESKAKKLAGIITLDLITKLCEGGEILFKYRDGTIKSLRFTLEDGRGLDKVVFRKKKASKFRITLLQSKQRLNEELN